MMPIVKRAVVVGLLLATAACGGTGVDVSAPTSPLPVSQWSQIEVPLSRFSLARSDWEVVNAGIKAAQDRCLARFGLPASADPGDPMTWTDMAVTHRYGVTNRATVEKYGYGGPPSTDPPKPRTVSAQQAIRDEVMSGNRADGRPSTVTDSNGATPGDGGCGKQGWDAVRDGTGFLADQELTQLSDESWDRMVASSQYKALLQEWTACMATRGYPDAAYGADNSHSTSKPDQIRAAVADLDCSEQVNYAGRANLIDSQIQVDIIKKNESQLRAILTSHEKLLENARRESQR